MIEESLTSKFALNIIALITKQLKTHFQMTKAKQMSDLALMTDWFLSLVQNSGWDRPATYP